MSFDIIVLLICASTSTGCVFLFCTIGSFTTDNFSRIADASYESLWYHFPTDLRKYLLLIVADAQRPRMFEGLGVIDLNLMTFTKVIQTDSCGRTNTFQFCSRRWWKPLPATIWRSEVWPNNTFEWEMGRASTPSLSGSHSPWAGIISAFGIGNKIGNFIKDTCNL